MTDDSKEKQLSLEYSFSPREIIILARFFRQKQTEIPEGLTDFMTAVEKTIYSSMSIQEAERFYS